MLMLRIFSVTIISAIAALQIGILLPSAVAEVYEPLEEVCKNNPEAAVCSGSSLNPREDPVASTLENVVNVVALVSGIIAVIIIVIAGFRFVLSNGDSTKVTNARNTIIYTAIGLIVIILARQIVAFFLF